MERSSDPEVSAIGLDTHSGATALLCRGIALLRRVASDPRALERTAQELCRAQPAMAGFRTAAAVVRSSSEPVQALERLEHQVRRAPEAIARHAVSLLELRRGTGTLRLVTCSASQAVETTILALSARLAIVVRCAEGRPQMEGRALATRLVEQKLATELYTDAGIGSALRGAEAVLVGADAVGPDSFINKVGTAGLAILAAAEGVPVYVLAGREKLLNEADFASLDLRAGNDAEVWETRPAGLVLRNPYFESTPLSCISALVTDGGVRHMSI